MQIGPAFRNAELTRTEGEREAKNAIGSKLINVEFRREGKEEKIERKEKEGKTEREKKGREKQKGRKKRKRSRKQERKRVIRARAGQLPR